MVRRVDGIEPLLRPVDVLSRADGLVLVDLRLGALPVDVRDRELRQQDEPAVHDRVLVAVERTHRRAGGAIPFVVVLPAVTWAAEAGRDGRRQRDKTIDALLRLVLQA